MYHIIIGTNSRRERHSLRRILGQQTDIYVVGCATTVDEIRFLCRHAELLLLSADFPVSDICQLVNDLRSAHPHLTVVMSGVRDQPYTILDYIEAGASGYILQSDSQEKVVEKVRAAPADEALISPEVAGYMITRLAQLAKSGKTGVIAQDS